MQGESAEEHQIIDAIIPAESLPPEKHRINHAHAIKNDGEQEEMPVGSVAFEPVHAGRLNVQGRGARDKCGVLEEKRCPGGETRLARSGPAFYCRRMKQKFLWLMIFSLAVAPVLGAQDAALEERLGKMSGYIEGLQEENSSLKKQIASMSREIQTLREQASQPNTSYATHDDMKRFEEKLREIDKKRIEDNERIAKQIENLARTLSKSSGVRPPKNTPAPNDNPQNNSGSNAGSGKGYNHEVAQGDTLSTIAQAYSKTSGTKITVDQILKANPNLLPEKLKVGQKVFIPKPE